MIAGVILATLTSIRASAELVHCQCQCLVCLDAQGAEGHSAGHEMLND